MSAGEINWSNWNDAYGWMPEQWCCMGTRNWLAVHAHNRRGGPMRDRRTTIEAKALDAEMPDWVDDGIARDAVWRDPDGEPWWLYDMLRTERECERMWSEHMGDEGVWWPSDVVAGHYVGGRTFVAARYALPSNGEAEKSDSASDDSPGHA